MDDVMKIWLVSRGRVAAYDEYRAHVVVAADEAAARGFARCGRECAYECRARRSYEERPATCIWLDRARTTCEAVGTADGRQEPGLLLSDYRGG